LLEQPMPTLRGFLSALVLVAGTACANDPGGERDGASNAAPAAAAATSATLDGAWTVPSLTGRDGPPRVTLADGKATGHSGCNDFSAGYTSGADGALAFGPVTATKMFCEGEPGTSEQALFAALAATKRATRDGTLMRLHDADGAVLLELARAP
jgi:heat shock protein HslJ